MLELQDVTKTFGKDITAVADVSLSLAPRVVGVMLIGVAVLRLAHPEPLRALALLAGVGAAAAWPGHLWNRRLPPPLTDKGLFP